MFVRNRSGLPTTLARGHLTDDFAIGAINLECAFSIGQRGLEPIALPPRTEADPPDVGGYPAWEGVSVTASCTVSGPSAPPFVRPVSLAVGGEEERLIAFGPRRWRRALWGGPLVPTDPEPFEQLHVGWAHAFGGGFTLPPGVLPGTDLPHPGGPVVYLLNEKGVGAYPDEASALDQPLPRIERADELIRAWNDRPEPGGLAPCPDLGALRVAHHARRMGQAEQAEIDHLGLGLFIQHHAPPRLVLRDVRPGASMSLRGLAAGPLVIEVPESPIDVVVRSTGKIGEPARPRIRSIHIDGDRRIVRVTHGHVFGYSPRKAPSWIVITRRQA